MWTEEDTVVPAGHTMTYKETLHIATNDFFFKLLLPGWALGLTDRLRKVKVGFEELRVCQKTKTKKFHACSYPEIITCVRCILLK